MRRRRSESIGNPLPVFLLTPTRSQTRNQTWSQTLSLSLIAPDGDVTRAGRLPPRRRRTKKTMTWTPLRTRMRRSSPRTRKCRAAPLQRLPSPRLVYFLVPPMPPLPLGRFSTRALQTAPPSIPRRLSTRRTIPRKLSTRRTIPRRLWTCRTLPWRSTSPRSLRTLTPRMVSSFLSSHPSKSSMLIPGHPSFSFFLESTQFLDPNWPPGARHTLSLSRSAKLRLTHVSCSHTSNVYRADRGHRRGRESCH